MVEEMTYRYINLFLLDISDFISESTNIVNYELKMIQKDGMFISGMLFDFEAFKQVEAFIEKKINFQGTVYFYNVHFYQA